MKKVFYLISGILIMGSAFLACKKNSGESLTQSGTNKQSEASVPPPPGYTTIHEYRTEARKLLGEALAKAMTDITVRNFVKASVTAMLNGETEFLYAQKFNTIVSNGQTFAQVLDNHSTKNLSFFTTELPYYDPYATILIPDDYEPENWNSAGAIPYVAAAPSGWDDENEVVVPFYNTNGQAGTVSSNEQPEELTVVIGECESLTAFLKPYSGPNNNLFFENDNYQYFLNDGIISIENGEEMVKQNDNSGNNLNRRACDRDNNTTKLDRMGSLSINGKMALKQMESWLKGRAELLYNYVYNSGTPSNSLIIADPKILPVIKRRQAKNSTAISVNTTHMIWGSSAQMDRYHIRFAEREGNGGSPDPRTTQLIFVINGITITWNQPINWRRRDRECGGQEVQFCTPANGSGTSFNSGLVTFNIHI